MKFKEYNQDQLYLIPPNIEEEIPSGDICRVINDIFDRIDLKHIEQQYTEEGNTAFHPRMMLKVLFYSYSNGILSSRRIQKEMERNIYYWYLSGRQRPDFRTIANFRKNRIDDIEKIFHDVVRLCLDLGIAEIRTVAVDGTKVKANANRDKFREGEWLQQKIKSEKEAIRKLLERAERVDAEEDQKNGDLRGDEIPAELHDRAERLRKLDDLMNKKKITEAKRINETDNDAGLMKNHGTFIPAYNCQAAVDVKSGVILSADVIATGNDSGQIKPRVENIEAEFKEKPEVVLADAGYFEGSDIKYLKDKGITGLIADKNSKDIKNEKDKTLTLEKKFLKSNFKYDKGKNIYLCPLGNELVPVSRKPIVEKRKNKYDAASIQYQCRTGKECDQRSLCCHGKRSRTIRRYDDEDMRDEMMQRLRSKDGYEQYKFRSKSIEPVFGNIKHNLRFRSFSLRGKRKTRGEFFIIVTVHNIEKMLKYFRGIQSQTV